MSNTFSYKQVWTDGFQKSNCAMPIYPVIADLQFAAGLKVGDTVNRRYRSNPIFANTLTSSGGYTVCQRRSKNASVCRSKNASMMGAKGPRTGGLFFWRHQAWVG